MIDDEKIEVLDKTVDEIPLGYRKFNTHTGSRRFTQIPRHVITRLRDTVETFTGEHGPVQ